MWAGGRGLKIILLYVGSIGISRFTVEGSCWDTVFFLVFRGMSRV